MNLRQHISQLTGKHCRESFQELADMNYSIADIARSFGIHVQTARRYLRMFDIKTAPKAQQRIESRRGGRKKGNQLDKRVPLTYNGITYGVCEPTNMWLYENTTWYERRKMK